MIKLLLYTIFELFNILTIFFDVYVYFCTQECILWHINMSTFIALCWFISLFAFAWLGRKMIAKDFAFCRRDEIQTGRDLLQASVYKKKYLREIWRLRRCVRHAEHLLHGSVVYISLEFFNRPQIKLDVFRDGGFRRFKKRVKLYRY